MDSNLTKRKTAPEEGLLYRYCKTHDKIAMNIILAIYVIFALVNFMKQYFPNIQIFSDVSPFKQEIEFYTSYMWVVGLLWAAEMVFYVTCMYTVFMDTDIGDREGIEKLNWKMLVLSFIFGFFRYTCITRATSSPTALLL